MMAQYDGTVRQQIKSARGKFVCMATTYFLGAFNDNFYKQAMVLLAISAQKEDYQGYATMVFTLPFVLFAAPAGWMADRFSKRNVVIGSKTLELAAMIFGAIGVIYLNWPLAFVMLAIMGIQATIFSPAINGSIPELYPEAYVTAANGIVKMFSVAAILGGIAMAGVALDLGGTRETSFGVPMGRAVVAIAVVAIALLGLLISFGVARRPAAAPGKRFPWTGPLDTLATLREISRDRELTTAVWGNAYLWSAGLVQLQVINFLGKKQFMLSDARTSYLLVAQLSGVALGGLASGRLCAGRWQRPIVAAAASMGAAMCAVAAVPSLDAAARMPVLHVLLGLAGLAGGIAMVPMESFIQVRPTPDRKGAVISAANFAAFSGMIFSGLAANLLNAHVLPTTSFALVGTMTLVGAAVLWFALRSARE